MKKYILLFIFVSVAFATISNEQILRKLNKIEHNQELLKQEMRLRFEAIDKRFENVDKRFEMLTNLMSALIAGIFGLIGFMMWDRRTIVDKSKVECAKEVIQSEEFNKKADKEYIDRHNKVYNDLQKQLTLDHVEISKKIRKENFKNNQINLRKRGIFND